MVSISTIQMAPRRCCLGDGGFGRPAVLFGRMAPPSVCNRHLPPQTSMRVPREETLLHSPVPRLVGFAFVADRFGCGWRLQSGTGACLPPPTLPSAHCVTASLPPVPFPWGDHRRAGVFFGRRGSQPEGPASQHPPARQRSPGGAGGRSAGIWLGQLQPFGKVSNFRQKAPKILVGEMGQNWQKKVGGIVDLKRITAAKPSLLCISPAARRLGTVFFFRPSRYETPVNSDSRALTGFYFVWGKRTIMNL